MLEESSTFVNDLHNETLLKPVCRRLEVYICQSMGSREYDSARIYSAVGESYIFLLVKI